MRLHAVAIAAILSVGMAAALSVSSPTAVRAATCAAFVHRAEVVVEHDDGQVVRACVGFDEATISGEDLLARSGIDYGTVSYGGGLGDAICRVDGQPQSYPPTCFSDSSPYWAIFVSHIGSSWQVSSQGASSIHLSDGDAEGFRYDPQGGAPASPAHPESPCQPPSPTVTPLPPAPSHGPGSLAVSTPSAASHSSAAGSPAAHVPVTPSSPTGAVAAVTITRSGGTTASVTRPGADETSLTGWLLASALGGGLTGMLILQLLRRRPGSST